MGLFAAKEPEVGAIAGPLTVSKLAVRGELPDDFREVYLKHIRQRVFVPLSPEEEADERMGWCVVGSPLELELTHENVFYNSYLNLGLRIDRWRLPPTLLKAQVVEAMQERLEKTGKERLSKTEKEELQARVAVRLKKKLIPTLRHFDLSWNLDTGVAYFWSQSPKVVDQLLVLFEQTFGLDFALYSPYVAATELDLNEAEATALATVEQTPFHGTRRAAQERADKERADNKERAERAQRERAERAAPAAEEG